MNFWNKLKERGRPIFVLAPMADVTDAAFRRVIAKYGKPDVTWTEFVSADGLARAPEEGRKKLLKDLEYTDAERPIVAQFFTANVDHMRQAAALALELGFDGVDINMGCPDQAVNRQGAGACLIRTPDVARALIEAAKEGAKSGEGGIPVSVKTRLGWSKDELETWLPALLAAEPAVITIHARTRKEMSKVPARWERVKRAVEIRDELDSEALIFGNGDAKDIAHARKLVEDSGADGVMLGKAIFGNPWMFSEHIPTIEEKLRVCAEHTKLFEELLGGTKSFNIMKKHYKAYVNGFDGASDLRAKLMEAKDATEVGEIIEDYLNLTKR